MGHLTANVVSIIQSAPFTYPKIKVIDGIVNNPKFQQIKSVKGKVVFVIENLYRRFLNWLNSSGAKQIEKMTSTLIGAFSKAIQNNAGPIAKAALKVGAKIGKAIGRGILDAISENPVVNMIFGGAGTVAGLVHYLEKKLKQRQVNPKYRDPRMLKGYYHGLSYVPYDGYVARLHKGERVLTAKENREYSRGGGATRLIQLIRRYGYNKDVDFELATVVATPPNLQIMLDEDGLVLDKDWLIVCEHLTQHSRRLTDGTTLTFESALEIGDKVIVASLEEKQLFIVIDKVVTF